MGPIFSTHLFVLGDCDRRPTLTSCWQRSSAKSSCTTPPPINPVAPTITARMVHLAVASIGVIVYNSRMDQGSVYDEACDYCGSWICRSECREEVGPDERGPRHPYR